MTSRTKSAINIVYGINDPQYYLNLLLFVNTDGGNIGDKQNLLSFGKT